MFETTMTSPQGKDQDCFGTLGTDWFTTGRQDNVRSKQRKGVGGEGMCVSHATRNLLQKTPRSECTLVIPLSIGNTVETNTGIAGRPSQPAVSQASTAMQGLPPSTDGNPNLNGPKPCQ